MVAELYELKDFHLFHELKHFPFCEVRIYRTFTDIKNLLLHILFRENANIWLNGMALKSIQKLGKVSSLTVSPDVENILSLQYGGFDQTWTLQIMPGKPL